MGFLINPIDGLSYLAKMNQGANGSWLFHLAYSAVEHQPVFIFVFYLFLGQVAGWFSVDLIVVFHVARIICALLFFFELQKLLDLVFQRRETRILASVSILFSGGLGWLYLFGKETPVDFWVAEAYPFLSAFVNPHFILTFAILVYLFNVIIKNEFAKSDYIKLCLAGIVIANISPFAVLIGGILLGLDLFIVWIKNKRLQWKKLFVFSIGAMPFSLYQFIVVRNVPLLRVWNEQNITDAPNILNLLLSFSPFLLINAFLLVWLWKKKLKLEKLQIILICWLIMAIAAVYLPINLQRRFLVCIHLANVLLLFSLVETYIKEKDKEIKILKPTTMLLVILSFFSNIIMIFGSMNAVKNRVPDLFVLQDLFSITNWLEQNTEESVVVLSNEDIGLRIPAYSANRAVLGHPFETPYYEETKKDVAKFLAAEMQLNEIVSIYDVDYILVSREENEKLKMGDNTLLFSNEGFYLYEVRK